MGRHNRPQLPGVAFHLTARLQDRKPLFRGIEPLIVRAIRHEAARTDGELLAYAVMPNHLHIVFVQGSRPLATFMQPLLRRLAIHTQRRTRTEGHIFERRFHSSPCLDPEYLRSAIAYVHLNAVRAAICESPNDYPWTSHGEYCALNDAPDTGMGACSGLRLFATDRAAPLADALRGYRSFLEWRARMDAYKEAHALGIIALIPRCPDLLGGDAYWSDRFGWRCAVHAESKHVRRVRLDLRDLAIRTLRDEAPEMPLDLLRSGSRSRPLVRVRRAFIRRAHDGGHRNRTIARFLRISDTTVSETLSQKCG